MGNISGDTVSGRDELITCGFPNLLLTLLAGKTMKLKIAQLVCWNLANLFKGKPAPPLELAKHFVPFFDGLLLVKDEEMLADTLSAVVHFTDDNSDSIKLLMQNVNLGNVLLHLANKNPNIKVPALKIIGNICSETANEVDVVLKAEGLTLLSYALNAPENTPEIQREVAWVISNIAVGPTEHIQGLIDSKLIEDLCRIVNGSPHYIVYDLFAANFLKLFS